MRYDACDREGILVAQDFLMACGKYPEDDERFVELLKKENTPFYVRGIRNTVDFEYENANLYASRKIDPNVIAVYIPCRQELLHVSSTIVKNSLKFSTPILVNLLICLTTSILANGL